MRIQIQNLGKRFNREWVFRNLELEIASGSKHAILGGNGSGKSTLLRIISAYFSASEGNIIHHQGSEIISADDVYKHISIAAPYLDVPGLFTLEEAITFHFKFKTPVNGLSIKEIEERSGLQAHAQKQIRHFSSGMKQRLRLSLALMSDVPLILLDEPASNLDAQAVQWYRNLILEFTVGKTLVVCSNHENREYDFCENVLELRK